MTASLRRRLQREVGCAVAWARGRDPSPVFEALGYAAFVDAIGARGLLARDEANALRRAGREALLAFGPDGSGTDGSTTGDADDAAGDAETLALARRSIADVARAGLAALERGSGAVPHRVAALAFHPPAATLVRILRGEADGLTAGRWAAHLRACDGCRHEIDVARRANGELDEPGLALAAARPAEVLAPARGRVVGTLKRPALEAVLFDSEHGRKLAVYAQASAPVRLVADGVTTEDTLEGYWIGRVEPAVTELHAQVFVDDEPVAWTLDLTGG
jgi:hypothetical protein